MLMFNQAAQVLAETTTNDFTDFTCQDLLVNGELDSCQNSGEKMWLPLWKGAITVQRTHSRVTPMHFSFQFIARKHLNMGWKIPGFYF